MDDKRKSSAPPRHRRYPRGPVKPRTAEKPERTRRWPRAASDRRVFPRG